MENLARVLLVKILAVVFWVVVIVACLWLALMSGGCGVLDDYVALYGSWECDDGSGFVLDGISDRGYIFGLDAEIIDIDGELRGTYGNFHCAGWGEYVVVTNRLDGMIVHDVAVYDMDMVDDGVMEGVVSRQNIFLKKGDIMEERAICWR